MPVLIEPHRGTCYQDAASTADAIAAAGFPEVHWAGGLGPMTVQDR